MVFRHQSMALERMKERVRLILPYEGGFLVEELKNLPNPGILRHIGGGVEHWETPLQALQREISEELGLVLPVSKVEYFNTYKDVHENPHHYFVWEEHPLVPGVYTHKSGHGAHVARVELKCLELGKLTKENNYMGPCLFYKEGRLWGTEGHYAV